VKYNLLITQAATGAMVWQYEDRISLQAGETHTFELPSFDIAPGTYRAKLRVDSAYDYNEQNELNNVHEVEFTVTR